MDYGHSNKSTLSNATKRLIRILIWDELQSFHRDERRREQTHERVRRYRERQRLAQEEEAQQESFQEESLIAEPSGEDQTDTPDEEPVVLSIDEFVEEAVVAEKAGDMPLEELPVSDEGEEPQTELKTLTGEAVTTPKAVKAMPRSKRIRISSGPCRAILLIA